MAIYLESCNVKGLKTTSNPIEYFEGYQMKALLAAPNEKTRTGRRNQMMLILYYDTAARILNFWIWISLPLRFIS